MVFALNDDLDLNTYKKRISVTAVKTNTLIYIPAEMFICNFFCDKGNDKAKLQK